MSLMRRREMMQAEDDIYEGFLMNTTLNAYDNTIPSDTHCVTPYYDINIGGVWTWWCGGENGKTPRMCIVKTDGKVSSLSNQSSFNMTWSIGYKIRIVMIQADLDDCWIKDSAGNYLFKGKNVE